jgi:hypothetical protein
MERVPVWSELVPFVNELSRGLDLPLDRESLPAGDEALSRVAAVFVAAAEKIFGVRLVIESPKLLRPWPKGLDEVDGTCSLDAFAAAHLAVPAAAEHFDGATLREFVTDEAESAFDELVARGQIVDCPLVVYGLGATIAAWLRRHARCIWVGADSVRVYEEVLGTAVGPGSARWAFRLPMRSGSSPIRARRSGPSG